MAGAHQAAAATTSYKLQLAARGYQILFHADETNRCPGCGGANWYVGRITAECATCGTAVPIAQSAMAGFAPIGRKAVALHVVEDCKPSNDRSDKRRDKRTPAKGRTLVLHVDGSPRAFAIDNISAGGIMGEAFPDVAGAKSLVVELEDGTRLPAALKWSDGAHAGLAFVEAT